MKDSQTKVIGINGFELHYPSVGPKRPNPSLPLARYGGEPANKSEVMRTPVQFLLVTAVPAV
jgi:hypothetical protein